MASITIQRPKLDSSVQYQAELGVGFITESGNDFYIPLTLENFSIPNINLTGINGTAASTTLTSAVSGMFDTVRPGDVLGVPSVGTFGTPATVARDCIVVGDSKMVIYPSTYSSNDLNVHAGDGVSGIGIDAGALVDKIDYDKRIIYLTVDNTADGSGITLTFAPPVRVTAVRKSTAIANSNQIDINVSVDTPLNASDVTVIGGASRAVYGVLKITDVDSTVSATAKHPITAARISGSEVKNTAEGFNGIPVETLNYSGLGTLTYDLDSYLTSARNPQTNV